MDDVDEFLKEKKEEENLSVGASNTNFSIDDEIDDLFASVSSSSNPSKQVSTPVRNNDISNSDFLAWLGESPATSESSSATTLAYKFSPGKVDSLFEELFDSTPSSITSFSGTVPKKGETITKEISNILKSNFIDVFSLKDALLESGFIPQNERCKAWNILLNGYLTEDFESLTYHCSTKDLENFENLENDVDEMLRKVDSKFLSSFPGFKQDIMDILVLYLMRKGLRYSPLYLPFAFIVLQHALPIGIPRSLSSSCFYSLVSSSLPLLHLSVSYYCSV